MLKFNLTQEGKTLIDALQNNDKLAITHIRLLQSGDSPSVDLPISRGAIVVDGTCNGPYAVVDVNDTSANNYLASAVALLSNEKSIAELYSDENTSGYEVVLSSGTPGRTEHPSIKYRTKTWASGKIPSRVDMMFDSGDQYVVLLSFGEKGGDPDDPSQQEVLARLTLGDNFPSTITFNNGDVWETDDTVSTTGVKNGSYSYGASSEMGGTSIRPLYSKVLIQKETNKQLKLRVSCQFDGAEKCKFNTTSINLPYATKFREGVVRFVDPSIYGTADGQRYNTVYSAADVDAKINQVTSSLGNLDQYAKKAEANEFTENNTFTKNITVNGEIGGNAVTDAGTDGDKHIVNVGYADGKYLSKTDATATYLTKTDAETTYLKKTDADTAATNYAKLNGGNTFTGGVNTFKEVNATKFSGDGVSSDISADAENNGTKLPTCAAVATFVDIKTSTLGQTITALQNKDNDLQSQIDGINAGQNLADIVNNTTELAAYDISHLKARDDQHGSSGAKWAIGDKVQVLGGGDVQSSVYELVKGDMPEGAGNIAATNYAGYYWRYIGVYGTNAYTKSEIDTKVDGINSALATKADTSYVDTELADKVDKTQIDIEITANAVDTQVPSSKAVKTYVDDELAKKANTTDVYSKTEADAKFAVKTGDNTFTGNNTFNGVISGTAVTSDIATDAANNGERLTTCAGVSSFVNTVVDNKINDLQIGSSYLKLSSKTVQTVESSVAFNGIISGTAVAAGKQQSEDGSKLVTVAYANEKFAQLAAENTFTGTTNTFQAITATTVSANTFTGNGVTTHQMSEEAITQGDDKIVSLGFAENRYVKQDNISDKTKIGAMGLFLYTGGDFKEMGTEVHGSLLHAVGMQLPMDGVVSWSQGTAVNTADKETTWRLLNNTIAGEPCLVLAIRVG